MTATATETATPVVKVGDFFECSWGYDQTNVDFYKVVGVTASGKSVKVQKWQSAVVPTEHEHFTQQHVVPGSGPVVGGWVRSPEGYSVYDHNAEAPVMTKRLRLGGYFGASFHVNSFSSAYLWDGKPQYETAPGFGH